MCGACLSWLCRMSSSQTRDCAHKLFQARVCVYDQIMVSLQQCYCVAI